MLQVSAAHREVLMSDDPDGIVLFQLTSRGRARAIALGDYNITLGATVYQATQNLEARQDAAQEGVGSASWSINLAPDKFDWFRDGSNVLHIKSSRLTVLLSLWHPMQGYLDPFIIFKGRGDDGSHDDLEMTVRFVDIFGYQPASRRWYLSKDDQRTADSTDGALDNINRRRPQQSVVVD